MLSWVSVAHVYWELILFTSLWCVIREDVVWLITICFWEKLLSSQLSEFCLRLYETIGTWIHWELVFMSWQLPNLILITTIFLCHQHMNLVSYLFSANFLFLQWGVLFWEAGVGVIPGSSQGLLQTLCSGISPSRTQGTIWSARDLTVVSHLQCKYLKPSISLA